MHLREKRTALPKIDGKELIVGRAVVSGLGALAKRLAETHRRTGSLQALDILTGRVVDNSTARTGPQQPTTHPARAGRRTGMFHGKTVVAGISATAALALVASPASAQRPADAGCEGRFVAFNNQFFSF